MSKQETRPTDDFEREAQSGSQGMLSEMVFFLKTSKKWWLTPILIALILLGVLVIASSSLAAPFIYTLF